MRVGGLGAGRGLTGQVREEGARALGDGLALNGALTSLGLARNGLGDKGAFALARRAVLLPVLWSARIRAGRSVAAHAGAVQKVGGAARDCGAAGGATRRGLAANRSLTELDLRANSLGPEGEKALAAAIGRGSGLQRLLLEGNTLPAAESIALGALATLRGSGARSNGAGLSGGGVAGRGTGGQPWGSPFASPVRSRPQSQPGVPPKQGGSLAGGPMQLPPMRWAGAAGAERQYNSDDEHFSDL